MMSVIHETKMDEDRLTIDPPLYLIGKMYSCWRCSARMPVVAILAPKVEGTEGEACILSEITQLPEALLAYIQQRVPTFKLTYSKTVEQKYFANTCPKCEMLSGDFHLHEEPGAPFSPTDEHEAASLYMTELPLPGRIHARASFSIGCGDLILKNARRIP
jgi:hypothetical protein